MFCILLGIVVVLSAIPYVGIFPRAHSRHHRYDETPYDNIIPGVDSDGDGLGDDIEDEIGTDPLNPDSDSDMMGDGVEYAFWEYKKAEVSKVLPVWVQDRYPDESVSEIVNRYSPAREIDDDPLSTKGDLDDDGLVNILDPDSDGDGLSDGKENSMGTDPANPDSDNDKIPDGEDPNPLGHRDEDDDNLPDDWEEFYGVDDPLGDIDRDGIKNIDEYLNGTDPTHPGDGEYSMGDVPPSTSDDYYGPRLNTTLFYVDPETHPSYWRLRSYDVYEETRWDNSDDGMSEYSGGELDVEPDVYRTKTHRTFGIMFWGNSRGYIPTAQHTSILFNISFNSTNGTDVVYMDGAGNFYSPTLVRSYQFSHLELTYASPDLENATVPLMADDPVLFDVPDNTSSYLKNEIIPDIPGKQVKPYQRALNIIQYLDENYNYNISAKMDPGDDWARQFLSVVKEGKCIDFATAFVLIARSLEIPARLVVGFSPGIEMDGYRIVKEGNRHAWAEVLFDGLGWIGFETTPYNNAQQGGTGIGSDGSDRSIHTWDGSPADGHGTNHGKEKNKTKDSDNDGLNDYDENNVYFTDPLNPDTDGDGLTDGGEVLDNLTDPLEVDTDGDGLNDYDEIYVHGTDPLSADTDGDGLTDGEEIDTYGTDPFDSDSDDDKLTDMQEIRHYLSNPLTNDTDGDTILDWEEVFWGSDASITDPLSVDTDGDGLTDHNELHLNKTDPLDPDTDSDGMTDGDEVLIYITDPLNPDSDGDGLKDGNEVLFYGSDPGLLDTDGDGLGDGKEVWLGYDPLVTEGKSLALDTDADGVPDFMELIIGTDCQIKDTDGDGIAEGPEIFSFHTDPLKNDTDSDGMTDGLELFKWFTDPFLADTDSDGLPDINETYTYGTRPNLPDSDLDGLKDGEECLVYDTNPKKKDTDDGYAWDGSEIRNGLDPMFRGDDRSIVDSDNDGLTDAQELIHHTDPENRDSDYDGLWDGEEVHSYQSDPLSKDTDHDGLDDLNEVMHLHTDPLRDDSDLDGMQDITEITVNFTHPLVNDTDRDRLSDGDENDTFHTDPLHPDTDRDGLWDGLEGDNGTDPLNPDTDGGGALDGVEVYSGDHDPHLPDDDEDLVDSDGDGLSDYDEKYIHFTDPKNFDTDNDTLGDGAEVNVHFTEPLNNDTDNDTLLDGAEVHVYKTHPLKNDTDGDNLTDGMEVKVYLTDPALNDTDGDLLTDWEELFLYGTDPLLKDTDMDTLDDYNEIFVYNTEPLINDTDSDGMLDGWEVTYGLEPLNGTDAYLDNDLDNLTNLDEFYNRTNPILNDTDGEGLLDGEELKTYNTNPLNPDTDDDTLTDWEEIFVYSTDPLSTDTDGDNMTDNWELQFELNPGNALDRDLDYDYDDLTNFEEFVLGTHPKLNDTDGDHLEDGDEVDTYGTSPILNDTDSDTLNDFDEIMVYLTNATNKDTDGDLLDDNDELFTYGTDPLLNDTDLDGLYDREEIFDFHTSPLVNDTDLDNLTDFDEVVTYLTNPLTNDTDLDGLDDWMELFVYKTKPKEMDTDKGGMDDGTEIALGRDPNDPGDDNETIKDIFVHPTEIRFTSVPGNLTKAETRTFDVSGRVTDENATGLDGVMVEIYLNRTLESTGTLVASGPTDANGIFVINCELPPNLHAGENVLRAKATSKIEGEGIMKVAYNSSWDDGLSVVPVFSPTIITFVNIPAKVFEGKNMEGRVYLKDVDNIPVNNATVFVYWEQTLAGENRTDQSGYTGFTYLVPEGIGRYKLYAKYFGSQYLFASNTSWEVPVSSEGVEIFLDSINDTNPSDNFRGGHDINITGIVYGFDDLNQTPVQGGTARITIKNREVGYPRDQKEVEVLNTGRYNLTYTFGRNQWPAGWYEVYTDYLGSDFYPASAASSDPSYFYMTGETDFSYVLVHTERNRTVTFQGILTDNTGQTLVGEEVMITYLGAEIYRETSFNGIYSFEYKVAERHPLGPIEVALLYAGKNDTDGRQRYLPSEGSGKIIVESHTQIELYTQIYNITRGESLTIKGRLLDDSGDPVVAPENLSLTEAHKIYLSIGPVEIGNVSTDKDGEFTYTSIVPLTTFKGQNALTVSFKGTTTGFRPTETVQNLYVWANTHISIKYSVAVKDALVKAGTLINIEMILVDDVQVPLRETPIEISYLGETRNLFTNSFGRVNETVNFPSGEDEFVISASYAGSKMNFYEASSAKKSVKEASTSSSADPEGYSSMGKEMLPIIVSLLLIGCILFYWNRWRKKHIGEMKTLFDEAINLLETTDEIRKVIYQTYIDMLNLLRKYGFLRKKHQTPKEFCEAVYDAVPARSSGHIYKMTDLFEEARYSEHKFKRRDKVRALKYFRRFRRGLEPVDK